MIIISVEFVEEFEGAREFRDGAVFVLVRREEVNTICLVVFEWFFFTDWYIHEHEIGLFPIINKSPSYLRVIMCVSQTTTSVPLQPLFITGVRTPVHQGIMIALRIRRRCPACYDRGFVLLVACDIDEVVQDAL